MTEIEIPKSGAYFTTGGARFHIKTESGRVTIRCVDSAGAANGDRLFTHQPYGNVVMVECN
jgi:hypothetical protein